MSAIATLAPPAPDDVDLSHSWIIAASIPITEKQARRAQLRCSVLTEDLVKTGVTKIDVLDTYCSGCRRNYEDVADQPCSAKINNEHLIGGDQRERVKRKGLQLPPGVQVTPIPAPRINRMGIAGILNGEASM